MFEPKAGKKILAKADSLINLAEIYFKCFTHSFESPEESQCG